MSDFSPIKAKLDAKVDLTESANKIVDAVVVHPTTGIHKAVTKMISACSGKWFANQERQIKLIAAQTEKDVEDIKSGKKEYRNGELLNIELAQTTKDYYRQVSEHNGACDAKRLEAVMLTAAIELCDISEDKISDEPLNQTFFNHWRAEAELIDDEDLRKWWAHLLVEETKKPNSISPRTLDVAKNLSRKEAKIFESFSNIVVIDTILAKKDQKPVCGNYNEILLLQDAGLIGAHTKHVLNEVTELPKMGKCICIPFYDCKFFLCFKKEMISYSCYVLTVAGKEIYDIQMKKTQLNDIIRIAEEISLQNNNAEAFIYSLSSGYEISGGAIVHNLDLTPLWSNQKITVARGESK